MKGVSEETLAKLSESKNTSGHVQIIKLPDGSAFVGHISQEVNISTETVVNLSLKPDTKALEEVVVVGYGNQQKKMLSTAVASGRTRTR